MSVISLHVPMNTAGFPNATHVSHLGFSGRAKENLSSFTAADPRPLTQRFQQKPSKNHPKHNKKNIVLSSSKFYHVLSVPQILFCWLVVLTILKNMKVRLDHHPNYWGKKSKCSKCSNQKLLVFLDSPWILIFRISF